MFNLPVISSSSRHSPDSSGMMHLNALNGSCHNDHNDTPSIHGATPPSYEDAFQSAPLFGLFSMNGVDGSHSTPHHHQYHHHHPFHNLHSQPSQNFPASSSHGLKGVRDSSPGSQVSCSLPSVSVSYASPSPNPSHSHARGSEHRSPGGDVTTGSDVTKSAANERPVSRGFRSREEGGTRFVGERFEMEEQCGRLSRISVVSNNSMMPKSPRPGSSARNQSQKDSLAPSRKNGSGNAGWQKHPGKEKSAFTSAKDTLYRVFSPIISRRQDRQNENPAKGGSKNKKQIATGNDESSEGEEMTSQFLRVRIPSTRPRSPQRDQFDDLGWEKEKSEKPRKTKPKSDSHHHTTPHHQQQQQQDKRPK